MADKLQGGVKAGSIDVSIDFVLRSTTDNTEVTGKVAADMTARYWRQGGTPTAIALSDLAAIDSAHADGGVKEADATNMPGSYRLDLPDAAIATGADWVEIDVKVAGAYVFKERFILTTNTIQSANYDSRLPAALVGGRMDSDVRAVAGTTQTAGDLAAMLTAIDAQLPPKMVKNTAFNNFMFKMVLSSDHVSPATGLTVTAQRSLDGAAFAACANAVTEIANGWYKINLAATDTNADAIALKFTAATADQRDFFVVPQS